MWADQDPSPAHGFFRDHQDWTVEQFPSKILYLARARVDLATKRGPHATDRCFLAFAMLDIDRVVSLNEANFDEYL